MKKEKLIELLRKAYLSGIMEKELADKMQGFKHDLESMATHYAVIEVNNVVLDGVIKCVACGSDSIYKGTKDNYCNDCSNFF